MMSNFPPGVTGQEPYFGEPKTQLCWLCGCDFYSYDLGEDGLCAECQEREVKDD